MEREKKISSNDKKNFSFVRLSEDKTINDHLNKKDFVRELTFRIEEKKSNNEDCIDCLFVFHDQMWRECCNR